jgi:hypothetical protein
MMGGKITVPRECLVGWVQILIQPRLLFREWALLRETIGLELEHLMAAANVMMGDAFPCILPVEGRVDGR